MTAPLSRDAERAAHFAGKNVALVLPAWHSCGTYRSVIGQVAAYRALGAKVFPVAISFDPGFVPDRPWIWRSFVEATPELNAGERYFGGTPFHVFANPRFLRDVVWPYIHGDQVVIRTGGAASARLSKELDGHTFDLVHCNHFFLMPIAERLAKGRAPIVLDSHDLQARQFVLMNENIPWLHPHATYETMLKQELTLMRGADLFFHVNTEENEEFRALLPEKAHVMLYPAGPEAPTGPGGPDIVLVASNNLANEKSVIWFLREVASRAPGVDFKIVGNVADGVRSRAPDLYEKYKSSFLGRVPDPGAAYANARLALLPTICGSGLSIKTIEAMASGLPLIATTHALRGMSSEAGALKGVKLADEPEAFARALRDAAASDHIPSADERRASSVHAYYEAHFSLATYERKLFGLVAPLFERASST
ncbi:MAG: glycosyltransferase family 4 protein [Methylovirgula sp.]